MLSFFSDLFREIRNPEKNSSTYFVGKSHLLFIALGIAILLATTAYIVDDHSSHTKDYTCFTGIVLNTLVIGFFVLSALFLFSRLYYSLWKGKAGTGISIIMQAGILLPIFLAVFARIFSLPGYLIPKSSNVAIAFSNLFAAFGFLFAGQATYKLLRIVSANLKLP